MRVSGKNALLIGPMKPRMSRATRRPLLTRAQIRERLRLLELSIPDYFARLDARYGG